MLPESRNFPKRNRIISALSDGILVVEGKYRSGTTITGKYGLEQGKEVFCIPHGISNNYGTGPNELIKKGAKLVTCPNEIIKHFEQKKYLLKKKLQKKLIKLFQK